jgi:hypothetical protein
MHEEESFLGKYILKGMNLAFLPYFCSKEKGEKGSYGINQSLFIQKSTLNFLETWVIMQC